MVFKSLESHCPLPQLPCYQLLEWNPMDLEVALPPSPGEQNLCWGWGAAASLREMPRKRFPFPTICKRNKEIAHETNSHRVLKKSSHPSHNVFGVRFTLQYFRSGSVVEVLVSGPFLGQCTEGGL